MRVRGSVNSRGPRGRGKGGIARSAQAVNASQRNPSALLRLIEESENYSNVTEKRLRVPNRTYADDYVDASFSESEPPRLNPLPKPPSRALNSKGPANQIAAVQSRENITAGSRGRGRSVTGGGISQQANTSLEHSNNAEQNSSGPTIQTEPKDNNGIDYAENEEENSTPALQNNAITTEDIPNEQEPYSPLRQQSSINAEDEEHDESGMFEEQYSQTQQRITNSVTSSIASSSPTQPRSVVIDSPRGSLGKTGKPNSGGPSQRGQRQLLLSHSSPQLGKRPLERNAASAGNSSMATNPQNGQVLLTPLQFQVYVKRSFEYLKVCNRELMEKVAVLESEAKRQRKSCICDVKEADDLENQFQLPLSSIEQVEAFEHQISDRTTRQKLILILSKRGGKDLSSVVRRIMERLFTQRVGASYTWTGKSGYGERKQVFQELKNTIAAVLGAVRCNEFTSTASDDEIEYQMREFMRHAPGKCYAEDVYSEVADADLEGLLSATD